MKPRTAWAWASPRRACGMIRLAEAVRSLRPTEARPTRREPACATGTTPTQRTTPAQMRRVILYMTALQRFYLPIGLRNAVVFPAFGCDFIFGLVTSFFMVSRNEGILE